MSQVITQPQEPHAMQCMEVWGGNALVDASVQMAGLDAWVYSRPFEHNEGGDVYYVSACATGRITRLLVADVSGHGQGVAAVARSLRGLMRQHVNHFDQIKFVKRMNESFTIESKAGIFATALVLTFFGPTRELSICNAGHPLPLCFRSKTKTWHFLEQKPGASMFRDDVAANLPLGIVDMADYELFQLKLEPDDLVLCFTDSLVEAVAESGEMLGHEGLLALMNRLPPVPASQVIGQLLGELVRVTGYKPPIDDVTMLLLKPNVVTSKVGFFKRARGPIHLAKNLVRSIFVCEEVLAMPDLKVANIGGAMIPALEGKKK